MASQRLGPRRVRRHTETRVPFVLKRFEDKLRRALNTTCERPSGTPGTSEPDFSGGTGRALKSWLFSCMLSKYDPGTGGEQRRFVALEKFWKAEERCFWTNLKFCQSDSDIERSHPAIARAKQAIYRLLGPEVPLAEISRGFGFGPGATTRLPKRHGDAVYKYSVKAEVTPNALSLGNAAILANPIWKQMFHLEEGPLPLVTTFGNKVTTVPKNYKTDRVIAVEPCLNMYVQKGLGAVIRRRLKKVGVDLDDQTLNQVAARDLSLATIDFSMASDLVSQGLVNYLLPPNWRDLIASMRSELGVLPDGSLHRYSKVSSMGNGFTFELESLIFWALASAVVPPDRQRHIRVYGDDVILKCEDAPAFLEISTFAGFIPNIDKSFLSGPFRESCGKHYFLGNDVTPFYVKNPVKTLSDVFLLHNQLYRWRERVREFLTYDEFFAVGQILNELRHLVPSKWRRPTLPDGYGDDAFIGSFNQCNPTVHKGGWECFRAVVYAERPLKGDFIEAPDGGILVKADKILRSRRWILPQVTELGVSADLPKRRRRKRTVMYVPWWAWG